MQVNHSTASTIGLSENGPPAAKLKSSHSFNDSPSSVNCNAHASPSQSVGNNGKNLSPYSPFSNDSKTEDLVLAKNGSNNCVIAQTNSPFCSNESSPSPAVCASPSTANAVASARPTSGTTTYAKRDSIKITIRPNKPDSRAHNNYTNPNSPGDAKGSGVSSPREIAGVRLEKPMALHNDKTHSATSVRSLSGQHNMNAGNTRRFHDSISLNQARSSSPRAGLNSAKFAENSLRNSPLIDYGIGETRGRNEGEMLKSYSSPSSTVVKAMGKSPLIGESVSTAPSAAIANATGNHHISRTSSSNSVSDLSPCSVITEENGAVSTTNTSLTNETTTSNVVGSHECNNETSSNIDLNISNSLLTPFGDIDSIQSEKIRLSLEQVSNFEFPDGGTGPGDIGSHALKLSAEDIQRTLNSVSAESELPDISLSEINHKVCLTPALDAKANLLSQTLDQPGKTKNDLKSVSNSKEGQHLLSPSASVVTVATSTSSSASAVTTIASSALTDTHSTSKVTTSSMTTAVTSSSYTSEVFPGTCTASPGQSSGTSVSYSSADVSTVSTKSHLQEILGVIDTNRLKNMARPVDSTQYSSSSTTSFSSKSSKSNPYLPRGPTLTNRPASLMMDTSPSNPIPGVSTRHRFASPAGGGSYPRPLHHGLGNPAHQMHYDHPGIPLDRTSNFVDMPMGSRPGMSFDPSRMSPSHRQMHNSNNIPHNLPSPSLNMPSSAVPWQRPSSVGGDVMSPNNLMGMGDMNKGSRVQTVGNFPQRSINPMTGLQSTVNSIPNLSSTIKSNNGNMGPPHVGQGDRTPTSQSDYMSDPRMLPPPSPSLHDKRSMSTDATTTNASKKGGKRERGQSLDSKDADKKGDSGPKSKRRKSKSKEETKKADSRGGCRPNAFNEPQSNSYLYVFNTDIANKAAEMVLEKATPSIVAHHNRYQGNSRLLPSKANSFSGNQSHNFGLKSPSTAVKSESTRPDTKPMLQSPLPNVSAIMSGSNQTVKLDPGPVCTSTSAQPKTQNTEMADILSTIKSEADSQVDSTTAVVTQASSPANLQVKIEEKPDKDLTDAQLKHREQSLEKLNNLRARFLAESSQPPPSSGTTAWRNQAHAAGKSTHYAMSQHLKKVQEMNKDSSLSEGWLELVKAYNEERKRNRSTLHCNNPDAVHEGHPLDPPPPYNHTGPPTHVNQRWIAPGQPIRDPGRVPEMGNPRYPHMGLRSQLRAPHDGARFPAGFPHSRFPRGYVVPSGSSGRMPMYGPSIPPPGMMLRGSVSRLSQPHNMGPSSEVYPFSEKLKEQASMYRTEGAHNPMYRPETIHGHQSVPAGFDMNNPVEGPMVPRMGSPEWPHYGNPPGSVPLGRLTPASHPSMGDPGTMMPNPTPMPGTGVDPSMSQGVVDPTIDPNPAMRMNNPSYPMTSFSGKGPVHMASYQDSPVPGVSPIVPSFPSQDMQPATSNMSGMMPHDPPVQGGLMGDAMARRGESRPPDLNINPGLPRSPPFHGGRHPAPSPNVAPNPAMNHPQYMPGNVPHASPHPTVVPQSPMINSPSMIKSPMRGPMSGPVPYMPMGQPGAMQSMEQGGMLPGGPASVDPGTPGDWSSMSQQNMGQPARTPSSGALPSNTGEKSAISQMIDGVNRFELPNALYRNEVKDTSSPPPLSHMNGHPGMAQEPPPLTHPTPMDPSAMQAGVGNPGMMVRNHHPGYDAGPRSAGPRPMGSMMGEGGFSSDFNRPLSHPTMCMSPGVMPGANMMLPGSMDMSGPSSGFLSQSSGMPISSNPGMAGAGPPVPAATHPPNARGIPEFDLTGMIPSEKPSQTLSYFPSGSAGAPDGGQMDENPPMSMRSPPLLPQPQQPLIRFPNISQRSLTPGSNPYLSSNPVMRMPGVSNYMPSNPPSYPGPANEGGYGMPPSWDAMGGGMVRGQMMPNNEANMAATGYMNGRHIM